MIKIASVEQMRQCDAYTIEHHISSMELIHRAAYSVFCEVAWYGRVAIVVGSGNNGADGFALACILQEHGIACAVFSVSERLHSDCAAWAELAKKSNVLMKPYVQGCLAGFNILVDCMLGTGFNGELRQMYRDAILEINESEAYVVSVDINSGMNGDSGAGENIVSSDLTVAIEFVKRGQLVPAAGEYMKKLVCVEIGIVNLFDLDCISERSMAPWLAENIRRHI